MDDPRFDSLTRALATGKNRRGILKGLLGLGVAAIADGSRLESEVDAARRPAPTPKPPTCPGQQVFSNGQCVCPPETPDKCGPDCCNTLDFASSTRSECCDNACCFGTCYGEELCCPTNVQFLDGQPAPPTHKICETNDSTLCCPFWGDCCAVDGCCDTICTGGVSGADFCCPTGQFCPNTNGIYDQCCASGTVCCGAETYDSTCVDLSAGGCCQDSDCNDPCQTCDLENHICGPRCDTETALCCPQQVGAAVCVTGECCPGASSCGQGNTCCQGSNGTTCVETSNCTEGCSDNDECGDCAYCVQGLCTEGCPGDTSCCGGECLTSDRICNDGVCCAEPCNQNGDCPNTCQATCRDACGTLGACDCGNCPTGTYCAPGNYCCLGEPNSDQNCGGCGNVCNTGRSCQDGTCVLDICADTNQNCIYDLDCCHGSCQGGVCA